MDTVEYIREKERMCNSFNLCYGCPLYDIRSTSPISPICDGDRPEEAVSIVEKWAREHPVMTNAQKFKEVFGVGPEYCSSPLRTSETVTTLAHEWWDEPYKEPEGKEN